MIRMPISYDQLLVRAHSLWTNQGLLLTSGDYALGHFNTMTIGWGSLGVMWKYPSVQVVVRPSRYTYEFMESYDTFTVCKLPLQYQQVMIQLGTKSGRDGDKIADAGLEPVASTSVAAPSFAEAELVLECKKVYWDDMDPRRFLNPNIAKNYPNGDYHRAYFGEIVAVLGEESFIG